MSLLKTIFSTCILTTFYGCSSPGEDTLLGHYTYDHSLVSTASTAKRSQVFADISSIENSHVMVDINAANEPHEESCHFRGMGFYLADKNQIKVPVEGGTVLIKPSSKDGIEISASSDMPEHKLENYCNNQATLLGFYKRTTVH